MRNLAILALCTLAAAAAFYLSQGTADLWWLAWAAPTPVLWIAYDTKRRWWTAALLGFCAFVLGEVYILECYARFMSVPIIVLQMLILASLFAISVSFSRQVDLRLGAPAALLAFPACWTGLEFLLGSLSPNGTFAALGYSQVSAPFLIQSASLFGLPAVTFLICLFANAVALALRGGRRAWLVAAIGFAICGLNGIYGAMRLDAPQPSGMRVAAIASNSDPFPATRAGDVKFASIYADAIRKAAAEGAQLAVTAEGAILTNREWRDAVYAPLGAVARQMRIEIVAGIAQRNPPTDEADTFHADGRVQHYDKRHPVPGLEARLVPGHAPGLLGQGRATVICKDMDFPPTIRSDAKNGIRLMAVPAGDFVLDDWIHARMAIMRSVEDGSAMVRAAADGLLTVSDAQGRVLARRSLPPRGVYALVADVPLGPGATLYSRTGDVFAWATITAALLLAASLLSARKRT
jgi:apolipoprotein N-acyltransferase